MSNTSEIYIPKGTNSAPKKPFLDLKDKSGDKDVTDHYLVKAIREKYEDLMSRDKDAWREMINKGTMVGLFIQGEQVLHFNRYTGLPTAVPVDPKNINDIRSVNKMQYYSTMFQSKWTSSKPDVLVESLSNFDEAVAQARKANRIIDHLERGWYDPFFDLQEGLMAQIWGWYGRRVKPDYTSKSFSQFKEIVEDVETPIGKGYGKCHDCGEQSEKPKVVAAGLKPMNACPHCDSTAYEYDAPIMQIMPKTVGREKVFIPEIKCESLFFPAVRFDLSKRMEQSSYLIIEREIDEATLHRMIGKIRFPEGESADNYGLQAIAELARRGVNQGAGGQSNAGKKSRNKYTLTEMYLGPDDLWDIKIGGDERTVEGETLPKGRRMSETHPDGAYIVGINGCAMILGIYKEHHSECTAAGMYHLKAMSGAGRGVDDAMQTQRQINRREKQKNDAMTNYATPATLIAEGVLDERGKRELSNPNARIPVKMQNFPEVRTIDGLIKKLQGDSVPGDLIGEIDNHLESVLQMQYHITPFSGGNPKVNNKTATGARLLEQNFDDLFTPSLAIKADVCVKTARNGFYMWCETNPFPRFVPFKSRSGNFGEEISGKDVNAEYAWSYVPGSEAPKTKLSEIEKKNFFYSQFGGIGGYLQAKAGAPKDLAKIERDFDMEDITDVGDDIGDTCRVRWEAARKIMDQQMQGQMESGQMQMDYLAILADVNPSMLPTEPELPTQAKWFQDLLISEEGRQMTDEERDLASAFIVCLNDLAKGQAIKMQIDAAEVQMAAQQPMQEAQVEQQAAQMQSEQAAQQEQLAIEAGKMAVEGGERQAERDHAKEIQTQQSLLKLAEMENQKEMQEKALSAGNKGN